MVAEGEASQAKLEVRGRARNAIFKTEVLVGL